MGTRSDGVLESWSVGAEEGAEIGKEWPAQAFGKCEAVNPYTGRPEAQLAKMSCPRT